MLQWKNYNYLGLRDMLPEPPKCMGRRPWSSDKARNIFNVLKQIFSCPSTAPPTCTFAPVSHKIFQKSSLLLDGLMLLFKKNLK